MLIRHLISLLFTRPTSGPAGLGRWGYHWETTKFGKYYD